MSLPGEIRKLAEDVVNRIAAGEVIQRPANALKELLENSLDAKSSSINIVLREGGLKLLMIQDNGVGIRKEDLEIVCERFTTSKLAQFEDLGNISTFGFRGEALASISHVAHLTVTTKTANDVCGHKASYMDGKLKSQPKSCAWNQGTQISAEDLFYNMPTRKKAFKSPATEHSKAAEVVAKYAIHNPSVGFSFKKSGENLCEIKTPTSSSHSENIKIIYGNNIARELLEVEVDDTTLKYKASGLISNVNYSSKKQTFILFINNRLVDSVALRKAIENVYTLYLPKGSFPFTYLSINLDPRNVDVNVHPTKHEVHFLHEEAVVDGIKEAIEAKLLGSNTSRVFYTQATLPVTILNPPSKSEEKNSSESKVAPKQMVRTDSSAQKLDKFLTFTPSSSNTPTTLSSQEKNEKRREIKLTSVLGLRMKVESSCDATMKEIMGNFTFVGCVNEKRALIQHSTSLYLCKTDKLMEEFFYQSLLYDFGNFGVIEFKEKLPLKEVALLGMEDPLAEWNDSLGSKEELAETASELLTSKAPMLHDYFSMEIDKSGNLNSLPLLLDNYIPDISMIPLFLLRLSCDVDWTSEKSCFDGICRETARLFSCLPEDKWKWIVEHVIFPAIKKSFLPPSTFGQDGTVVQVANLQELYKVFERC